MCISTVLQALSYKHEDRLPSPPFFYDLVPLCSSFLFVLVVVAHYFAFFSPPFLLLWSCQTSFFA